MDLRQYLALFRRWWWLFILLALVGGGGAFAAGYFREPVYKATTTILINQAPGALPDADAVIQGQRVAATYAELLHQRPVLEQVIANLGLDTDPDRLERDISVIPVQNTNLLELTVQDTDPDRAAQIANEIVRVFIEQNVEYQESRYAATLQSLQTELNATQAEIQRIEASLAALSNATSLTQEQIAERNRQEQILAGYRSSYASLLDRYEEARLAMAQTTDKVSVVEEALPGKRAGQPVWVLALQGATVGAVLAGGLVLLIEYLNDTIRSGQEAEQVAGAPALGAIGLIRTDSSDPRGILVTARKPRSPLAEAYRVLRSNLEFSSVDNPARTIVVTSSGPGEGKTTTAANLAISLAQAGRRVCLVDTDLRRPTLHRLFGKENRLGVTTAMMHGLGGMVGDHMVTTDVEGLYLMTSGPLPPNPADLLQSQRMVRLIEELKSLVDIAVFDSPPVLAVADAMLLARNCDAVLLVVLADTTRAGALAQAKEQIEQIGASLAGVVLNRVEVSRDGYYYYHRYYYYSSHEE